MTPHRAAQEIFNRTTFDPPTPEIVPAETIQVEHPMTHALPLGWAVVLGFALGVVLTLVGVSAWAPAARDGAFVLTDQAAPRLAASRINPLANGETK